MMTAMAAKTFKKMLADTDSLGWFAAADYLEEQGDCDGAESFRKESVLVTEILDLLISVASSPDDKLRFTRQLAFNNNLLLCVSGGRKVLNVMIMTKTNVERTRKIHGYPDSFVTWSRVSYLCHIGRLLILRPDRKYLIGRIRELVRSIQPIAMESPHA